MYTLPIIVLVASRIGAIPIDSFLRSSLENYTSNNTSTTRHNTSITRDNSKQHEYNTTQHKTARVQHDITRVQHDPTRVQGKLGQQKRGFTSHFSLLNYIFS